MQDEEQPVCPAWCDQSQTPAAIHAVHSRPSNVRGSLKNLPDLATIRCKYRAVGQGRETETAAILADGVVGGNRLTFVDEDRTLALLRALRSDLIDLDNFRT
jgi:hypothetical protein